MSDDKDPRLVDAEIAKYLAEAEKFKEEARNLVVERQVQEAEARQKIAHARSAEYGAEAMRIQTEQAQRQEKMTLAANHYHHEYLFWDPVAEGSVENCIAQLAVWHRLDNNCPMTIKFCSPGGDVVNGMYLFDEISAYSLRRGGTHKTTGIIRGEAASMAGILIQAFDHRVMGPEATLMIHEVSSWTGGSLGKLKDHMDHLNKLTERVADIFVKRSGKITPEEFEKLWTRKESYLDSVEALKWGFVDEVEGLNE